MEFSARLSPEEMQMLGTDQDVITPGDALTLMFAATGRFNNLRGRLFDTRGHTPGERGALNMAWNEQDVLQGMIADLHRLSNLPPSQNV